MRRLIFFLEEPSAQEFLKAILPKVLPKNIYPEFKIFEGKQDLEKNLTRILRAWYTPNSCFIVIRDQDSASCYEVKDKLVYLCEQSGREEVLVRVACRELESFYLGDLAAVEKGLCISKVARKQNSRKYREPDALGNPAQELERLSEGIYQKISGSRAIAPHLKIENNRSHSFRVLISGIPRLVELK